jgi:hypothetical protein
MKTILAATFAICTLAAAAQDTTRSAPVTTKPEKKKVVYQEAGFNMVTLLRQLDLLEISNEQLPYVVIYNLYFKNIVGVRLGGGVFSQSDQSETEGSVTPVIVNAEDINLRAGISYNFASHKVVTFNLFGDFVTSRSKLETISTTTFQTFPDPIITRTTKIAEHGTGYGYQAGFGLKVDIYKNLSLYTEMPFTWFLNRIDNESLEVDDGGKYSQTISRRYVSTYFVTLPTSVYLVLRF